MPIGMAPREDELALIESLARGEGNQTEQNKNRFNRDMASLAGEQDYNSKPRVSNIYEPLGASHGKNAHAISSKYGNFDFPAIPEHESV